MARVEKVRGCTSRIVTATTFSNQNNHPHNVNPKVKQHFLSTIGGLFQGVATQVLPIRTVLQRLSSHRR